MFDAWRVLPDGEREQRTLDPYVSCGPLRVGMSPAEVTDSLDGVMTTSHRALQGQDCYRAGASYGEQGLTLYYGPEEQLRGIVVDARFGPQVFAEGMALVGHVPSTLEKWISDRAAVRGEDYYYGGDYIPGSESLGVTINVRRAGDHVLSRPVIVARGYLQNGSYFPDEAWRISA